MDTKKTLVAIVRVAATNARLACEKFVHGKDLSFSPITSLAFRDEIALSNGEP